MEKLTVKITLNPKNYFDSRLIERLQSEKNMAGALKALAYERITIEGLLLTPMSNTASPTVPAKHLVSESETEKIQRELLERDVDNKINLMFDKF